MEENQVTDAMFAEQKICIHTYRLQCKTVKQPPGFADFLRGTLSLYQYCKKYGYKFYIDVSEHPIFRYFQKNAYFIHSAIDSTVYELFHFPFEQTDEMLMELFGSGDSFVTYTNAFYRMHPDDTAISNYSVLYDLEAKQFMRTILTPIPEITAAVEDVFQNVYKIDRKQSQYKIIHIRYGDAFIYNDAAIDPDGFQYYKTLIQNVLRKHPESTYILLTDSAKMGKRWQEEIPGLLYWENVKNHTGDLILGMDIKDTVIDFVIMMGASEIISNYMLHTTVSYCSGFSRCISVIYDIPYMNILDV